MEAVESMGLRMGCDTVHRVLVWQRFMRRVSGYAAGDSKQGKLCSCCDTRFGQWSYTDGGRICFEMNFRTLRRG